ncbi:MAG: alpha/beta hydrolase [Labilithrix sp.]|nr:alpha/beta hydrolase [Labilithrix sp.]
MSIVTESFTRRERIETQAGRIVLGLPDPVVRTLAGKPIERDGRVLDAQSQLAIVTRERSGKKLTHELSLEEARRDLDVTGRMLGPSPSVMAVTVSSRTLAAMPARVYRPRGAPRGGPALVYFHGGGFAAGSLESHDLVCREIAAATPCTVVAIDYRLAPEHPFPAAVDDATAAFRAVIAEAESLHVDAKRVAVGGDSAGGNLSAVVALDTRDDAARPCFQMLVYPVVDQTMSFPSIETMGKGFLLEKETIRWYRAHYTREAEREDPRASPWFAENLADLPPALVVTAGFDPLRDEGDAYAKRLSDAGVRVEHRSYASLFHGFWNTTGVIRAARAAFDETIVSLRRALRAP